MGRTLRWLVGAAGLALVCAVVTGTWIYRELSTPRADWSGSSVDVTIDPGLDAGTMMRRLEAAAVLRSPRLARAWLIWSGGDQELRAGEYRFDAPVSTLDVLRRLRRGEVLLHPVTVPEGLTAVEVASRLADAGLGDVETFRAAFADPTPIVDLDPEASDLEGYLFPDTYRFPRGERAPRIAEAMVRRFREVVGTRYPEMAGDSGLGLRGAVTLASLIEKETSLAEERERISGVFHNRLSRGMKLECDPTVIYALRRAGRSVGRLTYADLRFESPYNTYFSRGLPPGPIANPGLASLQAALNPAAVEDLYFVAAPEGGHRFSATIRDHRRAVAEWRRYERSSR